MNIARLLTPYKHLEGFLHRFTLINVGKLHIRFHQLLSADNTPFLHSHPYHYISFILKGGYSEVYEVDGSLQSATHKRFHLIGRRASVPHRIMEVEPDTWTLFFTWKTLSWKLKRHPDIAMPEDFWDPKDGVYFNEREAKYRNRMDGMWYLKGDTVEESLNKLIQTNHQDLQASEWVLVGQ